MAMVNIKGLDKAEVLLALWKSSRMQGMSFLGFLATGELTLEQAKKEVEERLNASAVCGERRCYFDYLNGRVLKVDISQDEFDSRLYDRDNGENAAQRAIDKLRHPQDPVIGQESEMCRTESREVTLLRAAKEFLIMLHNSEYYDCMACTVHYDDADCDGYCLIDDITACLCELEFEEATQNEKDI